MPLHLLTLKRTCKRADVFPVIPQYLHHQYDFHVFFGTVVFKYRFRLKYLRSFGCFPLDRKPCSLRGNDDQPAI